jgi:hypothetical protein
MAGTPRPATVKQVSKTVKTTVKDGRGNRKNGPRNRKIRDQPAPLDRRQLKIRGGDLMASSTAGCGCRFWSARR